MVRGCRSQCLQQPCGVEKAGWYSEMPDRVQSRGFSEAAGQGYSFHLEHQPGICKKTGPGGEENVLQPEPLGDLKTLILFKNGLSWSELNSILCLDLSVV